MKQSIILFLLLSLLLTACAAEAQPTVGPTEPTTRATEAPTAHPTTVPTEEPTEAPTEQKILLELRQFAPDSGSFEGTEAETEEVSVRLEVPDLPETELKPYENDPFLAPIAALLQDELGLALDGNWKFYIHYYTQEQDVGMVALTYWVDGTIATNRAITIPIENGTVRTIIYSYLDRTVDEAALLQKLEIFLGTHVQQRENLLGADFEIYGESTLYSYNFRTDRLMYTYNIFYLHTETGIIDNTYGTEVAIE